MRSGMFAFGVFFFFHFYSLSLFIRKYMLWLLSSPIHGYLFSVSIYDGSIRICSCPSRVSMSCLPLILLLLALQVTPPRIEVVLSLCISC